MIGGGGGGGDGGGGAAADADADADTAAALCCWCNDHNGINTEDGRKLVYIPEHTEPLARRVNLQPEPLHHITAGASRRAPPLPSFNSMLRTDTRQRRQRPSPSRSSSNRWAIPLYRFCSKT